jgi:hypothetical protein
MGDNFTSYSVEDTTICFKFHLTISFPENEELKISNGDETVLRVKVISVYETVAFVAQFFKLMLIANHSPSSINLSK